LYFIAFQSFKIDAFSLHELNEFIKRILAFNLPDEIWVQCELAQVGFSRGNYYIDLIEKDRDGDVVLAQSSAALWKSDYARLKKKHGTQLQDVLRDGIEVMIKVKVEFHERYGLKLVIKDIDMHFIMGKVEMQRRETIETLKKKGLLEKNNQHHLPPVLQRIAILSAEHAAGYQDFFKQLSDNQFGYDYYFTLFEVALQGTNTESTVIKALEEVNKRKADFDCIVIIRGGGSKMDLASFDSLELNQAIANAQLPVLTGIGHEIDETVADMVAYTSLKTPTAMAEFLIQRSYNFEAELMGKFEYLKNYTVEKIKTHQLIINQLEDRILSSALTTINNQNNQLDSHLQRILENTQHRIKNEASRLPIFEKTLNLITVEATLDRGFTITKIDGRALKKTDKIKPGQTITTISQTGEIISTADKVKVLK